MSAFHVPGLVFHLSLAIDRTADSKKTVTLTYWPSQLRDYGFQSSDHLHIQQAKLR